MRFQFGLSSLFVLTLLTACILSVYRCLGPVYGALSAVPLSIVAMLLLSTHWRCTPGAVIGAVLAGLVGFFLVIRFEKSDPQFVRAVTLGSFGGSWGGCIHAIILKRRVIGGILLALSLLVFAGSLLASRPARSRRPPCIPAVFEYPGIEEIRPLHLRETT